MIRILLCCFYIGFCLNARAQDIQTGTVQMKDEGIVLRVPITIWGESHWFIVDTGASKTSLALRFQNRLGAPVRDIQQETVGLKKLSVQLFAAPVMELGSSRLQTITLTCSDMGFLENIVGESCDGILGMDALASYVVTIDFDNGTLRLSTKPSQEMLISGDTVPMKRMGDHFLIPVTINGMGHIPLLIDTGADSFLSLNNTDWHWVFPQQPKILPVVIGIAGSNVITSEISRVPRVTIGVSSFEDILCAHLHSNTPSSVGLSFFRQHQVCFDFPGENLFVTALEHFQKQEPDMSGLHLIREGDTVEIYAIDPGSPGAETGLKPHDLIIAIDGQPTQAMSMRAIRNLLSTASVRPLVLNYSRSSSMNQVSFSLKSRI